MTGVLIRQGETKTHKGTHVREMRPKPKGCRRLRKLGEARMHSPYRVQKDCGSASTLISDSWLPEPRHNNSYCSESPSSWYFVTAALGTEHTGHRDSR